MPEFCGLTPILSVKSVPESIDYYVKKLGFKMDWDWGTPPTFASVSRGKVCIFFCQGGQGQPGTWMSIFVDDVDALYEEYKRTGAVIRQPPTNFQWGMPEMNIEDPDGHRLRMGHGIEEATDNTALCK